MYNYTCLYESALLIGIIPVCVLYTYLAGCIQDACKVMIFSYKIPQNARKGYFLARMCKACKKSFPLGSNKLLLYHKIATYISSVILRFMQVHIYVINSCMVSPNILCYSWKLLRKQVDALSSTVQQKNFEDKIIFKVTTQW